MADSTISLAIFNPAAAVATTAKAGSAGSVGRTDTSVDNTQVNTKASDETTKKTSSASNSNNDARVSVSQVSRNNAANGIAKLSFQTQKAIQDGALPPTVVKSSDSVVMKISDEAMQLSTTGSIESSSAVSASIASAAVALGSTVNIIV